MYVAAGIARDAHRDDLAGEINAAGADVRAVTLSTNRRPIGPPAMRESTEEVTISRWDLPSGPVWLWQRTTASWAGGDADVWEDLVLTEYDLSRPELLAAVEQLTTGISPASWDSQWAAENSQLRLRHAGPAELAEWARHLDAGLDTWIGAVRQLRAADPSPHRPPVVGGREL